MFSNEKSDFAVPVIGSLLLAMTLFIYGLYSINYKYDFLTSSYSILTVLFVFSILLTFFAVASLWKAYMIEGMTFLLVGAISLCTGVLGFQNIRDDIIILIVVILAIVVAFMSYRAGDIITLSINVLVAIASVGMLSSIDYDYVVVFGILTLIAGIIALYASVDDWMLVQDVASEYADDLYGDECICDDEECCCNGKEEQ
ncbi:MAG: hypothetical protein WC067_04910 [Candidatus Methanomethylophilaceae archaeon]